MIKKSLFALAALLGLAVACVDKTPEYEQIVATYYLSTNNTEVISLAANRGKDVNLNVKTRELTGGEANLTFTLKVDMEKVATYNAENQTEYVAMPTEAYTLNKAEIMVPRFNTGSTTVKVTVKAKGLEAGKIYILPLSIDTVKGGNYKLDETAQTVYILLELLEDDGSGDSGDGGNTSGGAYEFMQGVYDEKLEPAPASKVPDLTIKTVDDMRQLKGILSYSSCVIKPSFSINSSVDISFFVVSFNSKREILFGEDVRFAHSFFFLLCGMADLFSALAISSAAAILSSKLRRLTLNRLSPS